MRYRRDLTDAQVEAVIEGRNRNRDLASVSAAVDEIRALRNHAPSQPPAALIAQAAAIARESRPTPAAAPRPVPRSTWKFAPALAVLALVFTLMAPVAVLANSASPDDFLYPLDRLLERVGIGDGGLAERLTEAEILHERGDALGSAQHLARSMEEAEAAEVSNHVERATALVASLNASGPDTETLEALDAVASMLTEQPGENPAADPGSDNPNQGPGTNSGNDNPNQGPGNNSGNDNPNQGPGNNSGNDNPNQGPGNNSGNDNPNQGPGNNSGNDNPNQGPGNNSGNGNPNPGQGSNASGQPTGPPPSGEPGPGDPGSDQGEDQPGESGENPNKGSGNNSGNDGESNPNKGPGNNSGKGKNRP